MTDRVTVGNLRVAKVLHDFITNEALPGTGLDPESFWAGVDKVVADLTPKNQELLARRDELQAQIDKWHRQRVIEPVDPDAYQQFLTEIGYLRPSRRTSPSPRRASTARSPRPRDHNWWCRSSTPGSRSTPPTRGGDRLRRVVRHRVISETDGAEKGDSYNRVRGDKVIAYARGFLDDAVPLASGSWTEATRQDR